MAKDFITPPTFPSKTDGHFTFCVLSMLNISPQAGPLLCPDLYWIQEKDQTTGVKHMAHAQESWTF